MGFQVEKLLSSECEQSSAISLTAQLMVRVASVEMMFYSAGEENGQQRCDGNWRRSERSENEKHSHYAGAA
jgi:hypothetical protein